MRVCFRIVCLDNGIGMPPWFDGKNTELPGLRPVDSPVDQLNRTTGSGGGGRDTMYHDHPAEAGFFAHLKECSPASGGQAYCKGIPGGLSCAWLSCRAFFLAVKATVTWPVPCCRIYRSGNRIQTPVAILFLQEIFI